MNLSPNSDKKKSTGYAENISMPKKHEPKNDDE
jgi:hypothetical protein